ncbi:MAG: hypothetical protein V9E81_07210 [Marmoricola sp.]
MTADSTSSDVLRGTPVVGGVVLAPVLRVSSQLDPAALAAYVSPTDPELALADFDVAIAAVADNFKAKAQRAHGSAAEVPHRQCGFGARQGAAKPSPQKPQRWGRAH